MAILQGKTTGVSISKLCGWLGVPRRSFYYRPVKGAPKVKPELEAPVKALIEQEPSFGYRTMAWLLGRVREPFLLRSDNGVIVTSRNHTRLAHSYGLRQAFITPHCPQQNGMIERVIRTLKEHVHRHRFETRQHAMRVIDDWIPFYNHRRSHQALGMRHPPRRMLQRPDLRRNRWVNPGSQPNWRSKPSTASFAAALLPQMDIVGGPPASSGFTIN